MWAAACISRFINIFLLAGLVHPRILTTNREARLSLAETAPKYYYTTNVNGAYSFGYDVSDQASGNTQYRTEERYPNGTVIGTYGYVDAHGKPRRYRYVADERGYRVMRDQLSKPARVTLPPQPHSENTITESSITWTRPSKKKKPMSYDKPRKVYQYRPNDVHHPPSYFAYS